MKALTQKTLILLAVAVLMGVGALWPDNRLDPTRDLPSIAAFPAEQVHRIEITKGQLQKVVIEGQLDEGFRVLQPYAGPADTLGIRPMLRALEDGVGMDLRLDEGSLDNYGVDDQNGILVELFAADEETPRVSFVVGNNVQGGSSFVRLKDSEVVYRAKVGGRQRYDREVSDWRDRMVLSWDIEALTDIELARIDAEPLHFQRVPAGVAPDGAVAFGPWELLQDRSYDVDQDGVTALARSMAVLRAGAVLSSDFDAGWDPPASQVTLRTVDGSSVTLSFGQDELEGAAFVRLDPTGSVYRVAGSARANSLLPRQAWLNRQLFQINSSSVASATLVDREGRRVLSLSDDGLWVLTEPRNVDTDSKQAMFTVNSLCDLRADFVIEASLEDAGLVKPSQTMTLKLSSGEVLELQVGSSFMEGGRLMHFVKTADSPLIYALRDGAGTNSGLAHLRRGWGRAD